MGQAERTPVQVGAAGWRLVVRNGYLPEREIVTSLGPLLVQQLRVRDKRPAGTREVFSSKIVPPYLRKSKIVEEFLSWLYLKGVSTGEFHEALQSLLGLDTRF